jgi:hypothetical protein
MIPDSCPKGMSAMLKNGGPTALDGGGVVGDVATVTGCVVSWPLDHVAQRIADQDAVDPGAGTSRRAKLAS